MPGNPPLAYFPFDRERSAEATAYLLERLGGSRTKLFLIKLLYLADRESLRRFGAPISGGAYFSLEHGPIVSEALNLINETRYARRDWELVPTGNDVVLKRKSEFQSLSQDDRTVLDAVLAEHGKKTMEELYKYVHTLPEYTKPAGGVNRVPLATSAMLRATNVPPERIAAIERDLQDQKAMESILANAAKSIAERE